MIPYYMLNTSIQVVCVHGALIAVTSLLATGLFLCLGIACHAEQRLYALSLALLIPCTGLSVALPFLLHTAMTPLFQGILLLPLLLFPLSLPLRTLQRSWSATAQELGANRQARLRFFWWPLLQKSSGISFFLSLFFSIVQ